MIIVLGRKVTKAFAQALRKAGRCPEEESGGIHMGGGLWQLRVCGELLPCDKHMEVKE